MKRDVAFGNPYLADEADDLHADDLHVERVRRNIAHFDRWWRRPLIVLYAACAVILVGLIVFAASQFANLWQKMGINPAGIYAGIGFGIVIGFGFGVLIHAVVGGLIKALAGPRSERLMIRYYDALHGGSPKEAALVGSAEGGREQSR